MKKLFIVLVAATAFISCNDASTKEKYDRDKSTSREKDDYNKSGSIKPEPDQTTKKEPEVDQPDEAPADHAASNNWTEQHDAEFMTECISSAAEKVGPERGQKYCQCVLDKLKAAYPDYRVAEKELDDPASEGMLLRLAKECGAN